MTLQTIGVGRLKKTKNTLWYYNVEIVYQILSFTAKFFQSLTLLIAPTVYIVLHFT